VLECPLETTQTGSTILESRLSQQVAHVTTRVRRSLRPKRVALISELLAPLASRLSSAELGCPVILDGGKPFNLNSSASSMGAEHLREALTAAAGGM
jgi:hypothetical protein